MIRWVLLIGSVLLCCSNSVALSAAPLQITTTSLPDGLVGAPYSQTLTAAGGAAPYTWQVTAGRLPTGLALNASTGQISGIPTQAAYNGILTFQVTDTSSPPQSATALLTLTIPAILTITTKSLANGQVGVPYSQTLAASGGLLPYQWELTAGFLPAGLMLNATTGVISGTPTAAGTSGRLPFQVTDAGAPIPQTASASFTLTIEVGTPAITQVSPNSGQQGQTFTGVIITGAFTHFTQAAPVVTFTNGGVVASNVQVTDNTHLSVTLTIADSAVTGAASVTAVTGSETASGTGLFSVNPGTPMITQVVPNSAQPLGFNLPVSMAGKFTHWTQGSTTISFTSADIIVGSVTVVSSTALTVVITIAVSATPGPRGCTVTTGSEVVTDPTCFTILPGTPAISQVVPSSGQQGQQNLSITITGQFTHFSSGSIVTFSGTGITAGVPTAATLTSLTVPVTIAANAPLGAQGIQVVTGTETVSLANAFTVTAGIPVITLLNPASGQTEQILGDIQVCYDCSDSYVSSALDGADGPVFIFENNSGLDIASALFTLGPVGGSDSFKVGDLSTTGKFILAPGISNDGGSGHTFFAYTGSIVDTSDTGPNLDTTQFRFTGLQGALVIDSGVFTPATSKIAINDGVLFALPMNFLGGPSNADANGCACFGPRMVAPLVSLGTNINVTVSGGFTHFAQGMSLVNFGSDLLVNSVTVTSGTSLTANVTIPTTATLGAHTITVVTGSETVSLTNAFTVNAPTPTVLWTATGSVSGQTEQVTIVGQFTHFAAGATLASFGPGIAVGGAPAGSLGPVSVLSPTVATATLVIGASATPGLRNVTVQTGAENISLPNGFVLTNQPPSLAVSPASAQQLQTVTVSITGTNTNFIQGVTQANVGPGISVGGSFPGFFGPVTVNSPTSATASVSVGPNAAIGVTTITVETGAEQETILGGFTVTSAGPTITSVSPNFGPQGQGGPVAITGLNTHFAQGTTQVDFGSGIIVSNVTVSCPTCLTVQLAVAATAPIGPHDVIVTTGSEVATLAGGFTILPGGTPIISSFGPTSVSQGAQNVTLTVIGQFTHFAQGTTQVSLGVGVTVTSISVVSATSLTAQISIDPAATVGVRTLTVTTGAEVVSVANVFTVTAASPALYTLAPGGGTQGQQNLSVLITGLATHFVQGTSVATFGAGVTVTSLTVASSTSAAAIVNIDPAAVPGTRTVTVTTGTEAASFTNGFTVGASPPIVYTLNPGGSSQGATNLQVQITGLNTHFVQGTSVATFGAGITVTSLAVTNATTATATINIDVAATLGPRTVTVTTGTEVASFVNGFSVVAGVPGITQINPGGGPQGVQNLSLAITAQFTHFVQGTTTATVGAGVTVNSVTVTDSLHLSLSVSVSPTAALGSRTVTITTGTEVVSAPGGFMVSAGTPTLVSVSPASATQGQQNVNVTITGQFTNFVQGTSSVSFGGAGITVNSVTVASATSLTANISLAPTATIGARTVTVTTGSEVDTLVSAFTVQPAGNQPPVITIASTWSDVLPSALTISYTVTDPGLAQGGVLTVTWSMVSGPGTAGFQNQTPTSIVANFSQAGTYVLQISATDSFTPLTTNQNVTVTVTGTLPPPPTVSITSPTEGTSISTLTNVVGSVASPALASWTLEYHMANGSIFLPLATGTTAVTNAVLGVFDPTLLLNGFAQIQLRATDTSGQTSIFGPINVVVMGNQKVGLFTVSFNDLTVPVAGLPIQVVRTYDSRNKTAGDFGVGWRVDLTTVTLAANGPLGDNWTGTNSGGLFANYCIQSTTAKVVTITFADGTVFQFQPTLNPACQQLAPLSQTTVGFTPISTTPLNASLAIVGNNQPYVDGSFPGPITLLDLDDVSTFNPDLYQLTMPDGRVLLISQQSGLKSMTDTNGNKLTVTASGIASSTGKSVSFQRDATGRITQVTDPNGNAIVYSYDTSNDLASVKDAAGNITTFTYDGNHGLLTIVDPLGVQPIKNVYDASGRLIQHIDAYGNVINYTNNLSAQQEIVTDRLGNVTANYYDANGNIVQVTDALGGNTVRTYDANNNLLTETNPLQEKRTYTYDANNNRLTDTDPLGHKTTYTYNSRNQVLTITDALGRVTANAYDGNGNLTSTKDPLGNITTYIYNTAGLQTSMTDPLGGVTASQYDGSGNLTRQTDALGNVTTYTYDANGNRLSQTKTRTTSTGPQTLLTSYQYDGLNRVTQTTYPDGSTTQTQYNAIGKQSITTDQLGRQTSYAYDLMGRLLQTNYPDGTTASSAYDAEGDRIMSVDQAGRATTYVYDALKRLTKTIYPDQSVTQTTYDAAGEVTAVTDALGNRTQYVYDLAGRRTQVTDALSHTTGFMYDAVGNQIAMTDANNNTTQDQYDNDNRRTKVLYPDGTTDTTAYDALGRTISKTDEAGQITQFGYDKLGRLIQVTDAKSQVTAYTYDEVGDRITQTDANSETTTFAYDKLGRRTKRTLPLTMSETFAYDAAGNLSAHTDFKGKTTNYSYDNLNRLTKKSPDPSFAAPNVTFSYTATGQRLSMADASGTTSYAYDLRDRLITKGTPQGTLTYTYDLTGNLSTIRSSNMGGSTVNNTFDALNRLSMVQDNRLAAGTTSYSYDNVGNLNGFLYPNGAQTAYTYNTLNRLKNLSVTAGATTLASYAYTLGATGNRTAVSELGGRQVNYTYDALYRLTGETIAGAAMNGTIGYQYDAVGNRLNRSSTVAPVPATVSTYDANDRLTTDTYDVNGNTTASGGNTYGFDFENHLTTENGAAVMIVYDGDGNRVSKTVGGVTTRYLVDDRNLTGYAQVLEEVVSGAVQRVYTYGLNRISQSQASGTSFYGYDGHGNVRLLTDATGAGTDRYDYDAFGNVISQAGTTPNVYLYSGEQNDPNVGSYYLRARYYNQGSGRFLTSDFFGADSFDPQSLHRYTYAKNNPVNRVDRNGGESLVEISVSVAIQGVLSGVFSGTVTYISTGSIQKSLASAAGGFVVGAVIGGVVQGTQLLIATGAAAIGEAFGDVIITEDKLKYLLLLDPGKANGFKLLGYTVDNSDKLADVLAVARTLITDSTPKVITQFGVKYTVEMEIIGANGARGLIETVWQVDDFDTAYRLITAIPKPF